MDLSKSAITETLELTHRLQIELQLHSINQNGDLREAIKEDGADTRRIMEEFHKEMKEKVHAVLDNLQVGPNSGAIGQQERTVAEIVPNRSEILANQVCTPDHFFEPPFKLYIACP